MISTTFLPNDLSLETQENRLRACMLVNKIIQVNDMAKLILFASAILLRSRILLGLNFLVCSAIVLIVTEFIIVKAIEIISENPANKPYLSCIGGPAKGDFTLRLWTCDLQSDHRMLIPPLSRSRSNHNGNQSVFSLAQLNDDQSAANSRL